MSDPSKKPPAEETKKSETLSMVGHRRQRRYQRLGSDVFKVPENLAALTQISEQVKAVCTLSGWDVGPDMLWSAELTLSQDKQPGDHLIKSFLAILLLLSDARALERHSNQKEVLGKIPSLFAKIREYQDLVIAEQKHRFETEASLQALIATVLTSHGTSTPSVYAGDLCAQATFTQGLLQGAAIQQPIPQVSGKLGSLLQKALTKKSPAPKKGSAGNSGHNSANQEDVAMKEVAAEAKQEKPEDRTYQWYFKPEGQLTVLAAVGHFRNWLLTDKNLPPPPESVSSISIVQRGDWYAIRANLSLVKYRHDFAVYGKTSLKGLPLQGKIFSNRLEIPAPRPLPAFNSWVGFTVAIADLLAPNWETSFADYRP